VLRAEPIWITAARAGKRALVMQATGGFPFSARFPERLVQFDAYGDDLLTAEIVEGTLQADRFVFRIGDTDAVVRRAGPRAVSLAVGDSEVDLSLDGRYSPVVRVTVRGRQGLVRVGLLAFDSGSGRLLLARGDVVIVSSTHPELIPVLVAEAGVPLGEGAGTPYKRGRFGPTMADGGEGEAERGLIRAVVANHEYFDGVLRFAAGQPWDLLVLYVSSLDTTGHALVGMLDPDTPEHDPQLAERIWPVYEELFRRCADDYVAELRRRFPDAALVIGADHGMEGIRWRWHPNAVLRQAGLLHEDADGHVDLARTSALFLSSHAGGVYINSVRYQGGIVHDHERPALKRQITNALLSARDPGTGSPLVRSVVDTDLDGEALGIGGDLSPDLYFDPYPGYVASAAFGARELVVPLPPTRDGAHGPFPTRRRLHAIFYAAGPGIGPGVRPGLVRAVDVAPTVSRLLDIPPPADSVGRALPLDR
jgi:predicted AlkP superfamily phosphohydrolase/phosphomutase